MTTTPISTLQGALDSYLQAKEVEGCTEMTLAHIRVQVGGFVLWMESEGYPVAPQSLTTVHILEHLAWMKGRGLSPASVNTRYRNLRAWCNWMVKWGIIEVAPTKPMSPPKMPQRSKPFLSEQDFNSLLGLCDSSTLMGARRTAMLWLLATTGIRRNELFHLTVEDLEWDRGVIRVVYGKGQKERCVPFLPQAQAHTRHYLENFRGQEPGPLWITSHDRPLTYSGIGRDMDKLAKAAGIQMVDRCHIFRRTFAASAVRQAIPRQYVQAAAGWSTPEMMDLYTSWMQTETSEAIKAFQKFSPYPEAQGG